MLDGGDLVVGPEHALVEQVAHRQPVGMIADGHGGDDLLAVEEDGERALVHDVLGNGPALMVDALDRVRQLRGVGFGRDDELPCGRGVHHDAPA